MISLPHVMPCPCCGNEKAYIGTLYAFSQGVKCKRCGLQMLRDWEDEGTIQEARDNALLKAIEAWNKREK